MLPTTSRPLRAAALTVMAVAACALGAGHRLAAEESHSHRPLPRVHLVSKTPTPPGGPAGAAPPVGGSWTQLTHLPPVALDNCLLMTDGTVLCHGNATRDWYRLTPTNTGSYLNGTWTLDSSMQAGYAPMYFASAVLPDGRVIVEGGEYNCNPGCSGTWTTQGSMYDPSTRTWTAVPPPPGWSTIGDAQSVILADGTFMLADCCSGKSAFLNPGTLTWTAVAGSELDNEHDEESWTLLADGRVLTVDAWPGNSRLSEIFDPVTQHWTSAGNTPVLLTDNNRSGASYEQGPGILRTDGTVLYFGANGSGAGHTAYYDTGTGTWSAGPDFPNGDDAADAPAALLPNGNVLVQASRGIFSTPSRWYEVDRTTSAFTQVASPSYSFAISSYYGEMLLLPTGEVLQTEFSNDVRLYTASGTYDPSWRPTITSAPSTVTPGSTYAISGTQFNGLSQGAAYGDDWQSASNYPLVRITNVATGHVFYARTHDHVPMGVATGGQTASTSFDVPAGIETGASDLEVVANGIPSAPAAVTVGSASPDFGKTSPADGANGQPTTLTLHWGTSSGATGYQVLRRSGRQRRLRHDVDQHGRLDERERRRPDAGRDLLLAGPGLRRRDDDRRGWRHLVDVRDGGQPARGVQQDGAPEQRDESGDRPDPDLGRQQRGLQLRVLHRHGEQQHVRRILDERRRGDERGARRAEGRHEVLLASPGPQRRRDHRCQQRDVVGLHDRLRTARLQQVQAEQRRDQSAVEPDAQLGRQHRRDALRVLPRHHEQRRL